MVALARRRLARAGVAVLRFDSRGVGGGACALGGVEGRQALAELLGMARGGSAFRAQIEGREKKTRASRVSLPRRRRREASNRAQRARPSRSPKTFGRGRVPSRWRRGRRRCARYSRERRRPPRRRRVDRRALRLRVLADEREDAAHPLELGAQAALRASCARARRPRPRRRLPTRLGPSTLARLRSAPTPHLRTPAAGAEPPGSRSAPDGGRGGDGGGGVAGVAHQELFPGRRRALGREVGEGEAAKVLRRSSPPKGAHRAHSRRRRPGGVEYRRRARPPAFAMLARRPTEVCCSAPVLWEGARARGPRRRRPRTASLHAASPLAKLARARLRPPAPARASARARIFLDDRRRRRAQQRMLAGDVPSRRRPELGRAPAGARSRRRRRSRRRSAGTSAHCGRRPCAAGTALTAMLAVEDSRAAVSIAAADAAASRSASSIDFDGVPSTSAASAS